ncbi:MAG: CsbD family protein [Candidatus Acidiferrales bacterium]
MIRRSTKDKSEGALREVKGRIKEKAGQLTKNPDLEAEGFGEKITGKMQKKIGDLERIIENG